MIVASLLWPSSPKRSNPTINGTYALLHVSSTYAPSRLQMDISPDVLKSGQSLVLVLCASGEGVEGVALQAISVFGHCITDNLQQSTSFLQRLVSSVWLAVYIHVCW